MLVSVGPTFYKLQSLAQPSMKVPDWARPQTPTKWEPSGKRTNEQGVFKASSYHPGEVNAMLMDGSVRFVADGIDLRVWRAVATRSGGEMVGL